MYKLASLGSIVRELFVYVAIDLQTKVHSRNTTPCMLNVGKTSLNLHSPIQVPFEYISGDYIQKSSGWHIIVMSPARTMELTHDMEHHSMYDKPKR